MADRIVFDEQMGKQSHFSPALFRFLKALRRHNHREWFLAHKEQYEQDVREPSLRFITAFALPLHGIAPRFAAIPKPTGGSLFRIHRDTRFAADKRPYKTHVGIYFPHKEAGREQAPCFYLHLEPGSCFAGAGLWHPDTTALRAVREAIVRQPDGWRRVRRAGILSDEGDRLISAPRGYEASHPFIDDLKRKDFVSTEALSDASVCGRRFVEEFAAACVRMRPLVAFLTEAVGLPY